MNRTGDHEKAFKVRERLALAYNECVDGNMPVDLIAGTLGFCFSVLKQNGLDKQRSKDIILGSIDYHPEYQE